MRRLVVCDSHDGAWIHTGRALGRPGDHWDVLVQGVSAFRFQQQHREGLAALGAGVRVHDVGTFAPAAHRAVSPFVLDLVSRLPGLSAGGSTLAARLQDGPRNLWWSLEISEKSSFRGTLIERLYRLALLQEVLNAAAYDEVWLETADTEWVSVIDGAQCAPAVRRRRAAPQGGRSAAAGFVQRYWGRAGAAFLRFVAMRVLMTLCGWSRREQETGGRAIFTIYPYWWTRPYAADAVERFFSVRPSATRYVAWLMWPGELWRRRRAVTAVFAAHRIVPLQSWVRFRDAARLLSPFRFVRLLRAARAAGSLESIRFGRFDVTALVVRELVDSMSDAEVFFDHLIGTAVTRYATAARPDELLYRVEGQPWENALVLAGRVTTTRVVGFFHSSYGANYPALRFAPGDLVSASHCAGPRPVPPAMLVAGDVARRYLESDGYPANRIAACGPQRHADFVRFRRERPGRRELRERLGVPHGLMVYFVALAIVEVETEGLFTCLEHALAGHGDFLLLIKTHPNRPRGDASLQAAARAIGSDRVAYVPTDANMYEYIAAADGMICIGSTVVFEAMALGVLPVVYEHPGTFAVTSLRAFEDALYVVNSPERMRRALGEIASDSAAAAGRRRAFDRVVRGVLGDIDSPLEAQLTGALHRLATQTHTRRGPNPETGTT